MIHPFQCLLYCSLSEHREDDVVVAAAGPFIHSFSVQPGTLLSSWSSYDQTTLPVKRNDGIVTNSGGSLDTVDIEYSERPQKRQKLSVIEGDSDSTSTEIVIKGAGHSKASSKGDKRKYPQITNLAASSTGKYVVAVTGEDKCIRVFGFSIGGILKQLSERFLDQ